MLSSKLLLRIAQRLHAVWLARSTQSERALAWALDHLSVNYQTLQHANRRFKLAQAHGLHLILLSLRQQLWTRTEELLQACEGLHEQLEKPPARVPELASFLAELRQLEDEFPSIAVDWKQNYLAVTTEPIVLEGVELGPFALQLYWERVAQDADVGCWDIVALQPNPARGNARVTHPHVKYQRLCAGAAAHPLEKALHAGRLADAFCLIRSVLSHYNADSPHVPLSDWEGWECYDCGSSMSEEELWHCYQCDHNLCSDCHRVCSTCSNTFCPDCMGSCAVCEDPYCLDCLESCAHSRRLCCATCRLPCPGCGALIARDEVGDGGALHPDCPGNRQPVTS